MTDPKFHECNFPYQPIADIMAMLKAIRGRDKLIANYHSVTIARIGLSFAGKDSKLTVKDLLPFALDERSRDRITPETAEVLRRLIKARKLPGKVISAFSPYLKQLNSQG